MANSRINVKNKRAEFDYLLLDKFEAGIQLTGTEIKSIRANGASINEAFCAFKKSELFIRNMHIAPYENEGHYGHEPRRDRKLLLHRQELDKLKKKLKDQGMTIVPVRMFISKNGIAKLEIALAKGKKTHDKRDSLKEKDMKREMDRFK